MIVLEGITATSFRAVLLLQPSLRLTRRLNLEKAN
jgi:hypothetical protein